MPTMTVERIPELVPAGAAWEAAISSAFQEMTTLVSEYCAQTQVGVDGSALKLGRNEDNGRALVWHWTVPSNDSQVVFRAIAYENGDWYALDHDGKCRRCRESPAE